MRWHTCIQKVCIYQAFLTRLVACYLFLERYACRPGGARHHLTSTAMSFEYQQTQLKPQPLAIPGSPISSIIRRISRAPVVELFAGISLFSNSFQSPPPASLCNSLSLSSATPRRHKHTCAPWEKYVLFLMLHWQDKFDQTALLWGMKGTHLWFKIAQLFIQKKISILKINSAACRNQQSIALSTKATPANVSQTLSNKRSSCFWVPLQNQMFGEPAHAKG